MTKFSVNVNKFALLRNSRETNYPNVCTMAKRALEVGVHGITVHPRPDQRHIRYSDVYELKKLVSAYPHAEFNIEGNPIDQFIDIVLEVKPHQCTLVPDGEDQLTSDHGWDLSQVSELQKAKEAVSKISAAGIRTSLFMDANKDLIKKVPDTGADRIELYTEPYAQAFKTLEEDRVFEVFKSAAEEAYTLGLGVNGGHDLNLDNLSKFLTIPNMLEVSIGHAVVIESFDYGYENTLNRYLDITGR